MAEPRYNPDLEFETLRNELLQGKKYVFERPILIITASIAVLQFLDKQYAIYLPAIIIGLLFFNLWFTVNRIASMARIIGYIQLVLENKNKVWHGWETSLRNYRKWLKENNLKDRNIDFDKSAVYDNLGYYPTIYYMHIIVIMVTAIVLVIKTYCDYSIEKLVIAITTFIISVIFGVYSARNTPSKVKIGIEKNRQIWKCVYEDWDKLEK